MPEPDTGPLGFVMPHPPSNNRSPLTPSQGPDWSPWAILQHQSSSQVNVSATPHMPQPGSLYGNRNSMSLSTSLSSLSFSDVPHTPAGFVKHEAKAPPPVTPPEPSLTAPMPTIASLAAVLQSVEQPSFDPARKVTWCRDVLFLVERAQPQASTSGTASTDLPIGPARIEDPELQRLVNVAIPLLLNISSDLQNSSRPAPHVAEAIYLRATCEASGAFPQFVQHNPRIAFRDFETAAKGGHYNAWFKLGRDYESFNDVSHARDCFERGVKHGVESCLYVRSLIKCGYVYVKLTISISGWAWLT